MYSAYRTQFFFLSIICCYINFHGYLSQGHYLWLHGRSGQCWGRDLCFQTLGPVWMGACLSKSALQQAGNSSRVYTASCPKAAGIDSSRHLQTNQGILVRRWMDECYEMLVDTGETLGVGFCSGQCGSMCGSMCVFVMCYFCSRVQASKSLTVICCYCIPVIVSDQINQSQ